MNETPSKTKHRFESIMLVLFIIVSLAIGISRTGSVASGVVVSLLPIFLIILAMIVATWKIKDPLYSRIAYVTASFLIMLWQFTSIAQTLE